MTSEHAAIVIRDARPEDARAIAEVHVAGWRWGYRGLLDPGFLEGLSVERRADGWARAIEDADQDVAVAERDGHVVGFAGIATSRDEDADGHVGELTTVYLLEEHAGTGVGARLLAWAHGRLRERGFPRATLWVLDSNRRAQAFYERHGWRADGAQKTDERGVTLREVRYAVEL